MKIIGYSGLDGAINFRKRYYHGLSEQEYRMCQGLESAACLMIDGEIIAAAEEERFTGEKYTCEFPINAVNFCLQQGEINIHDIDYIAHGFNYLPYKPLFTMSEISEKCYDQILSPEAQIKLWKKNFPAYEIENKFVPVKFQ